jgi:hypothetical protein
MKRICLLFLGVVFSVAIAEAILRLFPTISGMQNPSPTMADPLIHYYPRAAYCYSRGWNFRNSICTTMNNFGYASAIDYSTTLPTVAVIGDSYVEALMTPGEKRLHEQIHKRLPIGQQAISLGLSGADLGDYLVAADYATKTFSVSWLVFLVNDGDISGAARPRLRGYWFKKGPHGIEINASANVKLRNLFYKSALLSYLYGNLKFNPNTVMQAKAAEESLPDDLSIREGEVLLNREYVVTFLEKLHSICVSRKIDPRRVILLIDADRKAIYEERPGWTFASELVRLMSNYGFRAVDLDPIFRGDWKAHSRTFDFGSFDQHWNPYAHRLVAERVMALIDPSAR